jgi:folate-binding protein YgfZ
VNIQIDLNKKLGLIEVSGTQNTDLLQGQITCDVTEAQKNQIRLGAHCNAKGRILSSFRLFYQTPHYYLLLPRPMISFVLEDFAKYSLFYDVKLHDVSDMWDMTGVQGEGLKQGLAQCIGQDEIQAEHIYVYKGNMILMLPEPEHRAILIKPASHTTDVSIIPIHKTAPFNVWQYLDIQSGCASIYPATRELFTPHHMHYHEKGGISFNKGCYTGQEVIARMHYLGKLKNKLYRLKIPAQGQPEAGSFVNDANGRPQGTIVMQALATEHTPPAYYALASLNNTAATQPLWVNTVPIEEVKPL